MALANVLMMGLLAMVSAESQSGNERQTSLDGVWSFAVDSGGVFQVQDVRHRGHWRSVTVPLSWQAQFPDLRDYQGVAWYRREITVSPVSPDSSVLLCFSAVDYRAEVYVNSQLVGTHEGGYTPFCCDVSSVIVEGVNEVLVRVMDPVLGAGGTEGFSYARIPHGKQSWYVQTSGLWQSVELRVVPKERILEVRLTPSLEGTLRADVMITPSARPAASRVIVVEVIDPDGKEVARAAREAASGADTFHLELHVKEPRHWSWRNPELYTVRVRLDHVHARCERFGFRTVEARGGRLVLNGEPFFMIGALDQDFYPGTMYSLPSTDALRRAFESAKRLGLNTLRCHIKVPDPRYLDLADELGLLVWYEIPNWDLFDAQVGRRAQQTLDAMIERDWNHPSLVAISLINESWGLDLKDADQRQWLLDEFRRAKQRAVGRLVIDNSACWGNFHLQTDMNDYHTYWAIPENRHRFDETVREMASRPDWLFSPYGDGCETREEPLVLSEFGNWGLPDISGPLPWWMERPFFDQQVVHPAGFEDRMRECGLTEVFGSYQGLARASQQAQAEALKYEIESLRSHEEVSGYVITEFTDINWECNGLLDMSRREKVCGEVLSMIQRDRLVMARPPTYGYWAGDTARLSLSFANFGSPVAGGGAVRWTTPGGQTGSRALPPVSAASVQRMDSLVFTLPEVSCITSLTIDLAACSASGDTLAKNSVTFFVYPRPHADGPNIRTHLIHRQGLENLGPPWDGVPPVSRGLAGASVVLTDVLDSAVVSYLLKGGRALCLVDKETVFPEGFPLTIIVRDTGMYDGNWASNLNWIRPSASPFRDLPSAPRLGFEAADMGLPLALGGVPRGAWNDVLAGLFVGWVHNNAAYLVQMKVGQGVLLLCAFPLAQRCEVDPFAATMLNRLLTYCGDPTTSSDLAWQPH